MPALFTQASGGTLAAKSAIRVKEAADGETAMANCVYLAPGGRQMKLAPGAQGEIIMRITDDPAGEQLQARGRLSVPLGRAALSRAGPSPPS